MVFERSNLFHNEYGKKVDEIWSNDAPKAVKTYKPHSIKGTTYFQYMLSCINKEYHHTQANFVFMNHEEIFLIPRVFQNKIEKYHKI